MDKNEALELTNKLGNNLTNEFFKLLDSNSTCLNNKNALRILLSGVQAFYFSTLYILFENMENASVSEKNKIIDRIEKLHLSTIKDLRVEVNGE